MQIKLISSIYLFLLSLISFVVSLCFFSFTSFSFPIFLFAARANDKSRKDISSRQDSLTYLLWLRKRKTEGIFKSGFMRMNPNTRKASRFLHYGHQIFLWFHTISFSFHFFLSFFYISFFLFLTSLFLLVSFSFFFLMFLFFFILFFFSYFFF